MSVFDDVRQDLIGKLSAAGVPAQSNPLAVPPFVLVGPPSVTAAEGVGGWAATFPVWVVSPPPDSPDALAWRLDQLQAVYGALGFGPAVPDLWGDRDCPAYQITYPRTVPNPAC